MGRPPWIRDTLMPTRDTHGKAPAARDAPKGLEPDATLDESHVHVVVGEEQCRGAHLAVDAGGKKYTLVGLPLHARAEEPLAVREALPRDGIALVVPDVVLGIALQDDLVGHVPERPDVSAGHDDEARLDVLRRADLAQRRGRHLELAGRGPRVQ